MDFKKIEDAEVLALSQTAPEAFGVLIDRYHKGFISKATRILGSKDDAEDAVQDTFVRIYKYSGKYAAQEGVQFKSWAYKILLNTCYTRGRKMNKENHIVAALDEEMLAALPDSDAAKERWLDSDEFMSALKRLPAMWSRLLSYIVEGKSYEDMAKLEGLTLGTLRVRIHRAKKEYRKIS
jgi:RNA polymerase sigma-70 factor (ECF subfamily)